VAGLLAVVAGTLLLGATVATCFGLAADAEARRARESEQLVAEAAGKAQENERWALERKREADDARAQAEKDKKRADDEARKAREEDRRSHTDPEPGHQRSYLTRERTGKEKN
jgi:hypothetical protein